eukprot:gene13150-14501_t
MFQEKNFDSDTSSLTKRKVLSIASQLFDPLGLVLPVTILARLFIAELWDEQLGWDQPLSSIKANAWKKSEQELTAASRLQFSRSLNFDSTLPVHLHVFTDASKLVMGAVSYLSQGIECVLLGSKSKLAPRVTNCAEQQSFKLYSLEAHANTNDTPDELHKERPVVRQRTARTAALKARDAIMGQLIDDIRD